MSKPKLILTRHRLVALLAAWLSAAAAGSSTPVVEPLFEPRVVDVKVEGVSLERVDVSMQIAVRASRNVTIRTLTFSDGYIDKIPVSVAPVEGRWPLRKGEEFVIPSRVQVTLQARDALATGGLASLLGRDAVDARATVEMSFDTPWMARMLRTATDVAIAEVAFKAPVPASSPLMQPLARLGAGVIEFLQRQAGPLLANGPGGQAATRDVIDRFGPAVATVETEYEIEGGPAPGRRTIKTLGLWWTPSIYCTTREAFEPWRYGAADASQLQIQGARLRAGSTRVRITSASAPPIPINPDELLQRLPKTTNRRVYSLATGEPRRMRMNVRAAPSALTCLRLGDQAGAPVATAGAPASPAPVAAFAVEVARGLVWTDTAATVGSVLALRTPVHRQSLGSPLVSGQAVIGLVASPDTAWDAQAIAAAAARAVRVSGRTGQRAGL